MCLSDVLTAFQVMQLFGVLAEEFHPHDFYRMSSQCRVANGRIEVRTDFKSEPVIFN
jgi:hypothetical protein